MNNPFLTEFLKRQEARKVKVAGPTTTPLPNKRGGVKAFAETKPTAKQVETYFRDKIERLNKKIEDEELDSD